MGFVRERLADTAYLGQVLLERTMAAAATSGRLELRLLKLFNFASFISVEPFARLIAKTVDFGKVRNSKLKLLITATNWDAGHVVTFTNEQLTDQQGVSLIMASAAIPAIFPPVEIPPTLYVDGGLLMNTPLNPAIVAGATELHVVYLDPDIAAAPRSELQTTLSTVQRSFSILLSDTFNHDIEHAAQINAGLDLVDRLSAPRPAGKGHDAVTAALPDLSVSEIGEVAKELERRIRGQRRRKLTIHRYQPSAQLGGPLGALSFEQETTRALIERGHADAVNHDCQTAGCLLAEGTAAGGQAP